MGATRGKNGFITLLLLAGIIINFIWSMRLEVEAAKARSLIDEHHASLQRNSDELARLKRFYRSVGKNDIDLQDQGIYITSGKYDLGFSADNNGIRLSSCSRAGTKDCLPVELSAGSGKDRLKVTLDPQKEHVVIRKGKAFVRVGKDRTGLGESVQIKVGKTKAIKVLEGKGIGIGSLDDKMVGLWAGSDSEFSLKIEPAKKRIAMKIDDTFGLEIGKSGNFGKWVSLKLDDNKSITLAEEKGIIIMSDSKPITINGNKSLDINFHGSININSKGNINIRSEKGIVRINGKRILLNE